MSIDKKILYVNAYLVFALLLLALFSQTKFGALLCALILTISATIVSLFIKKRSIYSFYKKEIAVWLGGIAFADIFLLYLSGLKFGFSRTWQLTPSLIFGNILPAIVAVIASEKVRSVFLAQNNKQTSVLSFLVCTLSEVLAFRTIPNITTFNAFMDATAMIFLPAVTANILYHYLARRYGMLPNIIFRLATGLFVYFIPYTPAIPDPLLVFIKLILPLAVYLFIDGQYEKKKRYALAKKSVFSVILTALVLVIGISLTMLISCQFRYGLLVVGSPSMTGEVNKGDAVVFDEYAGQTIEEGQVIVFEKNNSTIIHRVVAVDVINDEVRYTTKGDANDGVDSGYITNSDVVGLVKFKISYIGYPTLWLRSLFS